MQSLGASFLDLGIVGEQDEGGLRPRETDAGGAGAPARQCSPSGFPRFDVVISDPRAAIPGRPWPPRLIPGSAVEKMRRGSVIVDLAAETGGNCELTSPGEVIEVGGVWIDGTLNLPSTMAFNASQLYARNVAAPARPPRARRASSRSTGATRSRRAPASPERRKHEPFAQLVVELTILALAIFLGIEVISKVPTLLHTPLMSGTNAIHGIVIVGALLIAGIADPESAGRAGSGSSR